MTHPPASLLTTSLRNGAILATLAAAPILVGFAWNAVWGEPQAITPATYAALILAWIAGAAVVAVSSYNIQKAGKPVTWFYPCTNCGQRVALISYRCMRCKTRFSTPAEAVPFRNALLMGVIVFYPTFLLAGLLLNR